MSVHAFSSRFSDCISLAIGTGVGPVFIVITLDMESDYRSGLDSHFDVLENLSEVDHIIDILGGVSTT